MPNYENIPQELRQPDKWLMYYLSVDPKKPSEGLHSKSEDECIDIFDKVRSVFEYVFGNLNVQIEEARAFVKSLEGLQPTSKSAKGVKTPEQ